jgi:hypothetical protein
LVTLKRDKGKKTVGTITRTLKYMLSPKSQFVRQILQFKLFKKPFEIISLPLA